MKMEDIARLAGVSKSAVSLAFNDKPGISPETRERILRVAKEHGYEPKIRSAPQEQDANGAKTLTFLVITNSGIVLEGYSQQPFFRELIQFTEERCRGRGYSMRFASVGIDEFERDIEALAAEHHAAQGVILLGTNMTKAQIDAIHERFPNLAVLDTCYETLPVHFVQINNRMGAYQAGRLLCEAGHRSIGYIASDVRIQNFEERRLGFLAALEEHGLAVDERHRYTAAPTLLTSQEGLRKQWERTAGGGAMPTALFCECDYIAISAMKTLAELGYRVPEDVSVVGFDNITESIVVTPELTTVHVEKEQLARLAVDLLINQIEQIQTVKAKIKVDTRLVRRGSVAAPRP